MTRSEIAIIVMLAFVAGGCSATITPPRDPISPVTVYVADYGRHSSLILPNPAGGYTEYAWGEWDWFARGNAHWYEAPRALFCSDGSTLGMRNIPPQMTDEELRKYLTADALLRIQCPADRVAALCQQLDEQFSARSVTLIPSKRSGLAYVKDDEHYWLGHNCNHMTARWLQELGCKVKGSPTLSHFKLTSG